MNDYLELLSGRYVQVNFRVMSGQAKHVSGYLARMNETGLILVDNANLDLASEAGVIFVARENVAFVAVSFSPEVASLDRA